MKVTLVFALAIATTLAAPQQKGLKFRNLYKDVLPGGEPKGTIGGRIINGEVAEPHSIPYQAFLTFSSLFASWYCGGSLISKNYILTAGHCGDDALTVDIILGAQIPENDDEDSQLWISSWEITVHPEFDIDKILNDIAIIELATPVKVNDVIDIVPLPTLADLSNTYVDAIGKVSGWGVTTGDSNELSAELRWVENPIISNAKCNETFGSVEDYQICLSGEGGRGSCRGDSGGPLTVNGTQVGIVSYGRRGCPSGAPAGFTRITSFLQWIADHSDIQID